MRHVTLLMVVFLAVPALTAREPDDNEAKVSEALRKMRDPNPFIRIRGTGLIMDAQFDFRPYAKAIVPGMIRALDDPEETVRRNALWILRPFASELKNNVTKISASLDDPSPRVRENAANTLAYIGPEAKSAVPAIAKLLRTDKDHIVRRFACFALKSVGDKTDQVVDAFVMASRDPDSEVRRLSIQGIRQFATLTDEVSKALLERIKDDNEYIRKEAINAACGMKMNIKSLLPALKEALVDSNSLAGREAAANALKDLGNPALPILVECLAHKDARIRYDTVWALGFFGTEARSATNKLTGILQADPDASVRARAAAAIGAIGEPVSEVVPVLTKALKDEDKNVRVRAQEALDLIESRKKPPEKK